MRFKDCQLLASSVGRSEISAGNANLVQVSSVNAISAGVDAGPDSTGKRQTRVEHIESVNEAELQIGPPDLDNNVTRVFL